jgi:NAD(P)-dependent dehydrogenase (short-subunit alcohol dehydrogenase family)
MPTYLHGRIALVTGSTDGIGAAIAATLAADGAHVIVTGRDPAKGEKVTAAINGDAAIREGGGTAAFLTGDLRHGDGVRRLAAEVRGLAGGSPDILVNNAAQLIAPGPTADLSEDLIDTALAVNIKAVMLLTGLLAPGMAERGHGAIVNVGSINGLTGMNGSALYSMTKAAIHSLTKSWAAEYGPAGIRVNTVAPGPTLTEKTAAFADLIAPILGQAPSRRASTPTEVARAVAFLASDDASNIHGATLSVDGGLAAV